MFNRTRRSIINLLIAIDQLLHMILAAPKFIFFGGSVPNPDETISSKVGRQAIKGKRWALIAEFLIDSIFNLLGQKNHCRNSIED